MDGLEGVEWRDRSQVSTLPPDTFWVILTYNFVPELQTSHLDPPSNAQRIFSVFGCPPWPGEPQ
jgi:hypothetical protein